MSLSVSEQRISLGQMTYNIANSHSAGAPLLMLHGVTRRWQTFLPLAATLATRCRIIAPDFRGHGRTDPVVSQYRVIDYVEDAIRTLVDQTETPAVIYGHSLGAMVAVAAAAEAPDLVRAIILEDPPFETMGSRIFSTPLHSYFTAAQRLAGSNKPLEQLARDVAQLEYVDPISKTAIRQGDLRDPAALRFTAKCLSQLDPAVLEPIVAGAWLEGYDRAEILRRIRCPVLLLQADIEAGGMLTPEDAAAVKSSIADCTTVKLSGVSHLMHSAQPQKISDAIHNFLESLEVDRSATLHRVSQERAHEDF
ncbi:alpha/beta hydrolase [Blastopirellula sp. J2-11]|uniref:alpha/beta fold hydrolase n=1 Tax=Blastopirellula sp. J2-11 TaxID=2943192 RepID=UPI0021C5E380|nr:alpha/beta hydrolase [Blastopirellula sp. J2-11]UUO04348.1 alpha/beta hydrolase [Blastopirellula sp. J2-11]